jgi:gas vesicle protein
MKNQTELQKNGKFGFRGFLIGTLVGGLVGAGTILLVAPQSGKNTRAMIQQRSIELNKRMTNAVDDALTQTRHKAHQIKVDAQHQTQALQQRGQAVIEDQKERVSSFIEAGKTAVQGVLS